MNLKQESIIAGGQTVQADAPYTEIPLYIKAGSIIPCGPEIQYTTEKPADPIRLFVYTGSDCSFTLYEDENINYNYEKGLFLTIPISYNENDHTLTIGKQQGNFPGMLKSRTFEIVFIGKQKPCGFDFQSKPDAQITYDGSEQSIQMK